MKNIILCVLVILISNVTHAQLPVSSSALLKNNLVNSEWETAFSTPEDKNDFDRLKNFLKTKNGQLEFIKHSLDSYEYTRLKDSVEVGDIIQRVEEYLKKNKESVFESDQDNELAAIYYYNKPPKVYRADLQIYLTNQKKRKEEIRASAKEYSTLIRNQEIIQADITKCENQINKILTIEQAKQDYKTKVSLYFIVLIGFILLSFFVVLFFKSDKNLAKHLLNDSGLQFITIFVLIIAIILFGILGILEGRELSAILSGISGYILGRGLKSNIVVPQTGIATPNNTATGDKLIELVKKKIALESDISIKTKLKETTPDNTTEGKQQKTELENKLSALSAELTSVNTEIEDIKKKIN